MDIIEAIRTISIDVCQRETCFQDYLASLLNAKVRVIIDGIEVDVYGEGFAIEIKVNPRRIYDGIGQALVYKRLLKINEVWLLHIFTHNLDVQSWCKNLGDALEGLLINYAVITPRDNCIAQSDFYEYST